MINTRDSCQILINGQPLQEYKTTTRLKDQTTITSCFIPSLPNSTFSISYTYQGLDYPTGVYCDVYIDGNEVTGKHTSRREKRWMFEGKRVGGDLLQKLKFQKHNHLIHDSHQIYGDRLNEDDGKLGMIVVKLGQAELGDIYTGNDLSLELDKPITDSHNSADHSLALGEPFRSKVRMRYVKRSAPIRIFEFYYRSEEKLREMGVLPILDDYVPFENNWSGKHGFGGYQDCEDEDDGMDQDDEQMDLDLVFYDPFIDTDLNPRNLTKPQSTNPSPKLQPPTQISASTKQLLKAMAEDTTQDEDSQPTIYSKKRDVKLVDVDNPSPPKRTRIAMPEVIEVIDISD